LLIGFATMTLIIFLSSYIIIQIKKILPKEFQKTKQLKALKRNFVNFYKTYLQLIILLWSLVLLNFLIQFMTHINSDGADKWDETRQAIVANVPLDPINFPIHYTYRGIIFLIGKLGNISKALTPILLFYLRLRDPLLKQNIWYPFKHTLQKLKAEDNELEEELKSNTNDLIWINMLDSKYKESLHRTLLCGIGTFYPELMRMR